MHGAALPVVSALHVQTVLRALESYACRADAPTGKGGQVCRSSGGFPRVPDPCTSAPRQLVTFMCMQLSGACRDLLDHTLTTNEQQRISIQGIQSPGEEGMELGDVGLVLGGLAALLLVRGLQPSYALLQGQLLGREGVVLRLGPVRLSLLLPGPKGGRGQRS